MRFVAVVVVAGLSLTNRHHPLETHVPGDAGTYQDDHDGDVHQHETVVLRLVGPALEEQQDQADGHQAQQDFEPARGVDQIVGGDPPVITFHESGLGAGDSYNRHQSGAEFGGGQKGDDGVLEETLHEDHPEVAGGEIRAGMAASSAKPSSEIRVRTVI